MIFRGINPQQVAELTHNGKVSDRVGVDIKILDFLEPQYDGEQSLQLLLSNREASVGHASIVGSLSEPAEASLQRFLQFLEVLFSLDAGLLLRLLALLFLQPLFLLSLLELLLKLFGCFLGRRDDGLLFGHAKLYFYINLSTRNR